MVFDQLSESELVAPFTGAWIEITRDFIPEKEQGMSLPSRGRGLKY